MRIRSVNEKQVCRNNLPSDYGIHFNHIKKELKIEENDFKVILQTWL